MNIVVLNGSPKGDTSVTMQYVKFMQNKYPAHNFEPVNVSHTIKQIRENKSKFDEIIEKVRNADGIIWAFPLYIFLVPSQYKEFIELVFRRGAADAFKGKYAAVIGTSIHFHDNAAMDYMNAICDDLEMNFVGYYSAEMYELRLKDKRKRLAAFAGLFMVSMEEKRSTVRRFRPIRHEQGEYTPGEYDFKADAQGKKVVILTDDVSMDGNLGRMVDRLKNSFNPQAEVFDIKRIETKGGCLGCLRCGYDNQCAYQGKDQFIDFYKNTVMKADIVIFAGAVKDRFLSWEWKRFWDRGFFNTHTPSLIGKQIGFVISGPVSQLSTLEYVIQAFMEWQKANLVAIISDESNDSREIDNALRCLTYNACYMADRQYIKTPTFLGIGGMKIFRDHIWGPIRFPFKADHEYYKRTGVYDFPQKEKAQILQNFFMRALICIPKIRKEIYENQIKSEMVKPLEPFTKLTD